MTKIIYLALALVIGVIFGAVLAGFTAGKNTSLGGVTESDETFRGDVFVESDLDVTGNLTLDGDVTFGGGSLDVTSSNSATSTLTAGCIDSYATSTATAIKLVLGKALSTATTTFYGGTSQGAVYWTYGTCP